jgi:twinkle protein
LTEHEQYVKEEGVFTYKHHPARGISHDAMKKYNILTKFNIGDEPVAVFFPYTPDARTGKVRGFADKKIRAVGQMGECSLFGMDKFPPGSSNVITITEGEYDAASIYDVSGRPAVSIRGAASAKVDCTRARDYLNSFDKIILAFDADKPGQDAARAVAELFDFNKIYAVTFDPGLKDANGYLQKGLTDELKRTWWNHKRYMPEGVLSSFEEFNAAIDDNLFSDPLGSWPYQSLQEMTGGLRAGEATLITALEGVGKTEIIRGVEHHLLATTDLNIGIVHLEENKARTIKGLAGLSLKTPVHLPEASVSKEEIKSAFRDLVRRDDRLHVYSHFGSDDPDVILDTIRFMVAACGCRVVFLDHITMLATGLQEADERRTLDYLSTKIGQMVNDLKFHLIFISHVNDDGKTRGSRNISKIANTRIDMYRDVESADPVVRNTTNLSISKNRFTSITGPAKPLYFDPATFVMSEADAMVMDANFGMLPV